jgi:hypothetical protein
MSAPAATTRRLTDPELIVAVRERAALAEAEIGAAFRFPEGSSVREWHLERADTSTAELLALINGPQYREVWARLEGMVAPGWPIRTGVAA